MHTIQTKLRQLARYDDGKMYMYIIADHLNIYVLYIRI